MIVNAKCVITHQMAQIKEGRGGVGLQDLTNHNNYTNNYQHHNKFHTNLYDFQLSYYLHHVGRHMVHTLATLVVFIHYVLVSRVTLF